MFLVGIEAVSGFVQDQHIGIVQDRLRQPHPPAKPLGERIDRLVQHAGQSGLRHGPVPRRAGGRAMQIADPGDKAQKFARGHFAISGGAFRQIADFGLRPERVTADVVAADARRAAVGRQKAGHHLHGGGFARPIGPQETQNLALPDNKGQAGHCRDRVKTLGEVFNFEHSPEHKQGREVRLKKEAGLRKRTCPEGMTWSI